MLEEIKSFKKPISNEEFLEHERIYEEEQRVREEERELKRLEWEEEVLGHFDPVQFRTKTYEKISSLEEREKEEKQLKEEMKKQLLDKKDNYAKYVREMHLPPRSKKKMEQLNKQIERTKHPVR